MNKKECDLSTKTCHVPNLQRHHATCGLNYSLLIRLARRFGLENSLQFILPFGGQDCLVRMRFRDLGPYTGLCDSQCILLDGQSTWVPLPAFTVRLYHDMQLAEVTDESSSDFIQGAYPYPNPSMVQPDEREQLDQFLSEWLSYCLHHGLADLSAYGIDTNELSAQDIEVLSGLDPVKRRPGMYTDTTRPNHLVQEVVDNSVDEALAGYANRIDVTLSTDGSVSVADNGRGMPIDLHPEEGVLASS